MITPLDIKYSYRGTEYWVYECAKYLKGQGIEVRVLITKNKGTIPLVKNKDAARTFDTVPQEEIENSKMSLPFNFNITTYSNLPSDSIVYLPYSIYDYIINLMRKPAGQKYVVGAHGMHLKEGHIVKGHDFLEGWLNWFIKEFILSRKDSVKNIYHQVVNHSQMEYLIGLGVRKDHIFYIPPFIDFNDFKKGSNNSKMLNVIHIGGLQKGADVLASMILQLRSMGKLDLFQFYFVGREQPREIIELSKGNKNIHILSGVGEKEKREVLSRMDAMIIPAVENFPRAMLEGLASGLYVISNSMNPAAQEVKGLGAQIEIAKGSGDYHGLLVGLAEMKREGKLDKKREANRDVARLFDRKRIMPLTKKMFVKINKA